MVPTKHLYWVGAATFFILAGDYEGALEIVVKRMKEVHMGVVLLKLLYSILHLMNQIFQCDLWDPNENKEEFQRVLKEKILDNTADPFLRHILYFELDEPEESVEVLYVTTIIQFIKDCWTNIDAYH